MSEFKCLEPFHIDDGELDNIAPHEIFVLGVEWQMVYQRVEKPEGFETMIHAANKHRIEAMLNRHERQFKITFMADDVSEDWVWLQVKEK